jgi:hypothetical protein
MIVAAGFEDLLGLSDFAAVLPSLLADSYFFVSDEIYL